MRAIAEKTSALRPRRHSNKEVYPQARGNERKRTKNSFFLERALQQRRENQGPKPMRVGTQVYKIFITRDGLRHPNLDFDDLVFSCRFLALLVSFSFSSTKGEEIIVTSPFVCNFSPWPVQAICSWPRCSCSTFPNIPLATSCLLDITLHSL